MERVRSVSRLAARPASRRSGSLEWKRAWGARKALPPPLREVGGRVCAQPLLFQILNLCRRNLEALALIGLYTEESFVLEELKILRWVCLLWHLLGSV